MLFSSAIRFASSRYFIDFLASKPYCCTASGISNFSYTTNAVFSERVFSLSLDLTLDIKSSFSSSLTANTNIIDTQFFVLFGLLGYN